MTRLGGEILTERRLIDSFENKIRSLYGKLPFGPLDELDDLSVHGLSRRLVHPANLPSILRQSFSEVDFSKGMCLQVYSSETLTELRLAMGRSLPISYSGDGKRIIFQVWEHRALQIKEGFYGTPVFWQEEDGKLHPLERGVQHDGRLEITYAQRLANLTFANQVVRALSTKKMFQKAG